MIGFGAFIAAFIALFTFFTVLGRSSYNKAVYKPRSRSWKYVLLTFVVDVGISVAIIALASSTLHYALAGGLLALAATLIFEKRWIDKQVSSKRH